jgi:hypothetical protein
MPARGHPGKALRLALVMVGAAGWLAGCAGYRLGPTNGMTAGSRSIQVNPFANDTAEPRLSDAVTSSLRKQLQHDGTYRLDTQNEGDVIVSGRLTRFDRYYLTFQPRDVVTPRDFRVQMTAHVVATERLTGRKLLERDVIGHSTVRITTDLPSVERQAVPLIAEDLARNITALLVDGTW